MLMKKTMASNLCKQTRHEQTFIYRRIPLVYFPCSNHHVSSSLPHAYKHRCCAEWIHTTESGLFRWLMLSQCKTREEDSGCPTTRADLRISLSVEHYAFFSAGWVGQNILKPQLCQCNTPTHWPPHSRELLSNRVYAMGFLIQTKIQRHDEQNRCESNGGEKCIYI